MWFYMSPLKFKFEFKSKRNDDHRADSLFPNSVIVLSCILAFFQIRTYVRNPALRSTTSFKHFLLLELFCKIGQSHKEWTQNTFPGHFFRAYAVRTVMLTLQENSVTIAVSQWWQKRGRSSSKVVPEI